MRHSTAVSVLNDREIVILGGYYNGNKTTGGHHKGKLADALIYNKEEDTLKRVIESAPFAFDTSSQAYLVGRQRVVTLVRDEQKVLRLLRF